MTNLDEAKRQYAEHITRDALAEEDKRRAVENKYARLLVLKCKTCDHIILLVDSTPLVDTRHHFMGRIMICSNCNKEGLLLKDISIIECMYEISHLAGIGTPIASMQAFNMPDCLTLK